MLGRTHAGGSTVMTPQSRRKATPDEDVDVECIPETEIKGGGSHMISADVASRPLMRQPCFGEAHFTVGNAAVITILAHIPKHITGCTSCGYVSSAMAPGCCRYKNPLQKPSARLANVPATLFTMSVHDVRQCSTVRDIKALLEVNLLSLALLPQEGFR